MLSILPKHVADEMLKDMKKDESQKDQQQFNTMYMYRHENVRCARHGPGLPGQHGAGPRGVGVAPQAREVPADWEPGHPPRSVHPGRERPCRGRRGRDARWAVRSSPRVAQTSPGVGT